MNFRRTPYELPAVSLGGAAGFQAFFGGGSNARHPRLPPQAAMSVFQPERMRLARELQERSQDSLAKALELSPGALSQFESGTSIPSQKTQHALAMELNVPPAFLTLPLSVDTHEGFFRSLRRTPVGKRRLARGIAQIAHDIAANATVDLPVVDVPVLHTPGPDADRHAVEVIADEVRSRWGVEPGPILDVVGLLESHGIIVLRSGLASQDVDAFSLPYEDRPLVVLGGDKNDRARSRFDAAHELGHLVMHGEQVWGLKWVEDQAHMFAAAFLMPSADIYNELPRSLDWDKFFSLKRRWHVSIAALLMRARRLGTINETQYLTGVKGMSARGWRRVEPVPLGPCEQPALLSAAVTQMPEAVRKAHPSVLMEAMSAQ